MSLLVATKPHEEHRSIFDMGSLTPLTAGFVGGVANVNPAFLAVGLLLYEGIKTEHLFYRTTAPNESLANKMADILLGVGGYVIGEWVRVKRPDLLTSLAQRIESAASPVDS